MKIFGWVHRQFLHKAAKKDNDDDKVALLKNEGFSGASDGWNDGILAIGTLGVDFQDFKPKVDTFMGNKELFFDDDDDGDHDEEMESPLVPLVRKASNHAVDHVVKQNLSPCEDFGKPNNHQEDDDHVVDVKGLTKVKKSGARTTLAELLRADAEDNSFKNDKLSGYTINKNKSNGNSISDSNSNASTQSGKSFLASKAKKKQLGKDDLIKKAKQLLRKILRKKIHPDIGLQKEGVPIVGHVHATS